MPPAKQDHDTRLDAIELKLMDMEQTVAELNEVILRHYQDIERLQLENAALNKRLDDVGNSSDGNTPSAADEVPPHY